MPGFQQGYAAPDEFSVLQTFEALAHAGSVGPVDSGILNRNFDPGAPAPVTDEHSRLGPREVLRRFFNLGQAASSQDLEEQALEGIVRVVRAYSLDCAPTQPSAVVGEPRCGDLKVLRICCQ